MTIFAVLLPVAQPSLAEKITTVFGTNALRVSDTQWLVSASGTAQEISGRLGLNDPANEGPPPTGTAIVFATAGYFGRAPINIWEWIKAKLEAPPAPPESLAPPPRLAASG